MKNALLVAALLSGCTGNVPKERWQYERVLWEREPAVRSGEDAASRFERLSARPELTLGECYQMAIHRSETLSLTGEELIRIQSQFEQAIGSILPKISFKGSYLRQDDSGLSGSLSTFTLKERTEYKFSAKQPIFSGLKEYYAIRQADALYAAKEEDLRHARLLLFADVAQTFYAVLQAERELATTEDTLRLARERLEELVQRNKAGLSRRSEVLAQEAEVALTQARVEDLRGVLEVAWEAFLFVTGLRDRRTLVDSFPEPGDLLPIDAYVAGAKVRRSDLKSLQKQIDGAEESLGIARSGWLPTLTLDANYYTHRVGISEDVDWDVTLSFEVPLFDGLTTSAKVREAESIIRSARLRHERLLREMTLEINRAYADVKSLQSERSSLDKALASAQENYEIVQAEYRQGIVTNVEVLASFNVLQRARLDRDRAQHQLKLAAIRLSVQSGEAP